MKKSLLTRGFIGIVLLMLLQVGGIAQTKTITPEIIADLSFVTEAKISPDGNQIAYVLRLPGGESDKPGARWYELFVMDKDGNNAVKYVSKPMSARHIAWSKDGKSLYFLARRADVSSKTQIYQIALGGGEATPLTNFKASVGDYHFSPDGSKIAVTMRDGKSADEEADNKAGKDWIVYGENYKYNRLFVHDIASGKTDQVFNDNLHVSNFGWSPDGKTLVFQAAQNPETDNVYMYQKMYKVAATGGSPTVITETAGKLGPLAVSPDGSTLAWAGAVDINDPLPQSLFVVPMAGGAPKNLTVKMEASVVDLAWMNADEILLHNAEGVYTTLYKVNKKNGKRTNIYKDGAILRGVDMHAATGQMVAVGNTPEHPSEVMLGSLTQPFKRMTHHNKVLKDIKMGKQEVMEWKGPDGFKIQGIVTYPPNYQSGKKYPLLLQIHGGPEGISYHGFNTRAVYPVQWYAANGWVVLEPNYRGSQGRGVAFSKADHKDLAGKEFEDVLKGIDALADKGIIDPAKVATGGFSYGGYFSAWAATKHSDRFRAAMVGAGITNWISFTGTTDIIWENSLVHWNLMWYDEFELVWDRSPLAHINNAKTPTLIVHGENDLRVPPGQGLEMYNALKLKEVPTEMVVYKRQPHGIYERAAQIDYMNRTLNWYNKHTK